MAWKIESLGGWIIKRMVYLKIWRYTNSPWPKIKIIKMEDLFVFKKMNITILLYIVQKFSQIIKMNI